MVSWSTFDEAAYYARQSAGKAPQSSANDGCSDESELHGQIVAFCNSQWPKWKFIHARMDQRSTIEKGAQDFTVFLPNKRVLCLECKARGKKPDEKQRNWAFEMKRLGHTVYCIRSYEEFLAAASIETNHQPPHDNATSPEPSHVRD